MVITFNGFLLVFPCMGFELTKLLLFLTLLNCRGYNDTDKNRIALDI